MVNFFQIQASGKKNFVFADLPGYGYSATGGGHSRQWSSLITSYLQRDNIAHLFFLFDVRRKIESFELEWLNWLTQERLMAVTMVATKIDKLSKNELQKTLTPLKASLTKDTRLQLCSVKNKKGLAQLNEIIMNTCEELLAK